LQDWSKPSARATPLEAGLPTFCDFKAEHGSVAAVEITRDALRFLLCDLNGAEFGPLGNTDREIAVHNLHQICRQISKEVRKLLRRKKLMETKLTALTWVSLRSVNVEGGTVVALSALLNWNDVPLGPIADKEFKCPVVIG